MALCHAERHAGRLCHVESGAMLALA